MPLTIRPQSLILDALLSALLAGDIVTDISPISVLRQLCEGMASTQADLGYDLYSLLNTFYLTTAEGVDLDIRGADYNLRRDTGQAASDNVTYYARAAYGDDIPLDTQQVLQATLLDGTEILYRSLGAHTLMPSGRSVSGQAPGTALSSGLNDTLLVNLDGDGPRALTLGTQTSGEAIASAIQAQMRALVAFSEMHQDAYSLFRCD